MHRKMGKYYKNVKNIGIIKIDTLDTPEKFCSMVNEIVPILATILRDIAELREQLIKRLNKLDKHKPDGRYSPTVHSNTPAL